MNRRYLQEIKKLQKMFFPLGFDVSVGGGLAYDAFVGKLTRSHSDLDIDIIGSVDYQSGFSQLYQQVLAVYPKITSVKKNRIIVEKNKFVIDLEYVQIINESKNIYRYSDGEFAYPVTAYLKNRGCLGDNHFTIDNPHFLFAIKLLQPILGKKLIRTKDVHDLSLIRPHLNTSEIIKSAQFELEYFKKQLNKLNVN